MRQAALVSPGVAASSKATPQGCATGARAALRPFGGKPKVTPHLPRAPESRRTLTALGFANRSVKPSQHWLLLVRRIQPLTGDCQRRAGATVTVMSSRRGFFDSAQAYISWPACAANCPLRCAARHWPARLRGRRHRRDHRRHQRDQRQDPLVIAVIIAIALLAAAFCSPWSRSPMGLRDRAWACGTTPEAVVFRPQRCIADEAAQPAVQHRQGFFRSHGHAVGNSLGE